VPAWAGCQTRRRLGRPRSAAIHAACCGGALPADNWSSHRLTRPQSAALGGRLVRACSSSRRSSADVLLLWRRPGGWRAASFAGMPPRCTATSSSVNPTLCARAGDRCPSRTGARLSPGRPPAPLGRLGVAGAGPHRVAGSASSGSTSSASCTSLAGVQRARDGTPGRHGPADAGSLRSCRAGLPEGRSRQAGRGLGGPAKPRSR